MPVQSPIYQWKGVSMLAIQNYTYQDISGNLHTKFVVDKNDSCNIMFRHVQYICTGKTIKNEINNSVPFSSGLFGKFHGLIRVEQLSAHLMMLKEA